MKLHNRLLLVFLVSPPAVHPFFIPRFLRSSSSSIGTCSTTSTQETYKSITTTKNTRYMSASAAEGEYINIEAIAAKYGLPGSTDPEGFDPYADTVGPGIYGGSVQRDTNGNVIIGEQYQNHNHRPGPVYDGKGYSLMSRAIHMGDSKVKELLKEYPNLKDEISTGGARPLHVCGMSQRGQLATQALVDAGADLYALDTYNYNALHRMASNNLHLGAEVLVKAGMDPNHRPQQSDSSPIDIARRSRAINFLRKMQELGHYD